MQKPGPWKRPVDNEATGWPPCLRMMAAVVVLVKLTLGQPLNVVAPHAIETIVHQPPDRWLSNARITYYQAMLLNPEQVQFGATASLNPATLLPNMEPGAWVPHDCHQILAATHGTREDLTDQPLSDAEPTWYTDGNSFLQNSEQKAGAVVVDRQTTIWASALPPGPRHKKQNS